MRLFLYLGFLLAICIAFQLQTGIGSTYASRQVIREEPVPFTRKPIAPNESEAACRFERAEDDADYVSPPMPLGEWLNGPEVSSFPSSTRIGDARLGVDQRFQIGFTASVKIRELPLSRSASRDLLFISGVNDRQGKILVTAKTARKVIGDQDLPDSEVTFRNCVFLQPGDYILWNAIYDVESGKHNVSKRRVRIDKLDSDPLPRILSGSPVAEFPTLVGSNSGFAVPAPANLNLPIANRRPVSVDLLFLVNSSQLQSDNRIRAILQGIGTLAQMKLADGSISVSGLDLQKREVMFTENRAGRLDFGQLVDTTVKAADDLSVSLFELQTRKEEPSFLREFLRQKLQSPSPLHRIILVLSGSMTFDRGADHSPLKLNSNCNCNVSYLAFRFNEEGFDDIGRVLTGTNTRRFNIASGRDLRKAMADIIRYVEKY